MGIKLKDLIDTDDQNDSLVEDKSKKTMKLLILGIVVLVFIILMVIVTIIKNSIVSKNLAEIAQLSKDISHLSSQVAAIGAKYRSGIEEVELIGTPLEEEPMELYINGKREEYKYGYYLLSPEQTNSLVPMLNRNDQSYIVNYITGEVINVAGVNYNGRKYHSNIDIAALASNQRPPSDDTVYINSAQDMELIRNNPSGYYKLSADIDMSIYSEGDGWNPIEKFSGVFDGRGYKIQNLKINRNSERYCGLFGEVSSQAVLSAIVLTNVEVNGEEYTGALAGSCSGIVNNCEVTGSVNGSGKSVGGLIGSYSVNSVNNSFANVSVTGTEDVGGLIGTLHSGAINSSYSEGVVVGSRNIGGLIGTIRPTGLTELNQTYANARISGTENVGGLIGDIDMFKEAKISIKYAYANGTIEGANKAVGGFAGKIYTAGKGTLLLDQLYAATDLPIDSELRGGFVGAMTPNFNTSLNINKCLWEKQAYEDIELEGTGNTDTTTTFKSASEAEMKIESTYNQWDWQNVWNIEDDYSRPYFKWQKI